MPPRRTTNIRIPPPINSAGELGQMVDWFGSSILNSANIAPTPSIEYRFNEGPATVGMAQPPQPTRPDWYDTPYPLRECHAALINRIGRVCLNINNLMVNNTHWMETYPAQSEAYIGYKREVEERLTARKREIARAMETADLATGSLLGFDPNEQLPYETVTFEEFVRYWQDPPQQYDPGGSLQPDAPPARRRNPTPYTIPHWSDRILQVDREANELEPEPVVINGQKSLARLRGSRAHVSLQFQTPRGSYPRSAVTLVITGHGMVLQRTVQHYLDCCHGLQLAHRADDPREYQIIAEEKHDGE